MRRPSGTLLHGCHTFFFFFIKQRATLMIFKIPVCCFLGGITMNTTPALLCTPMTARYGVLHKKLLKPVALETLYVHPRACVPTVVSMLYLYIYIMHEMPWMVPITWITVRVFKIKMNLCQYWDRQSPWAERATEWWWHHHAIMALSVSEPANKDLHVWLIFFCAGTTTFLS